MGLIQVVMVLPIAVLVVVLVHDFLAGLGEERLWGDPVKGDGR